MADVIPKEVKKEQVERWIAETWKACLLTNAFIYVSGTHILYSNLTNEVVGTGYTAGGKVVSKSAWGVTSGYIDATSAVIDADDTIWTAVSLTNVRYVAIYETAGGRIRGIYQFIEDKTIAAGTFTVRWNPSGLIKVL